MNDDRLGPYRLLRRLGEGGMGVVHLAVDQHGRQVAVKVLRAEVAGDEVARRRLSREVETMRRVRSKYIAEVLDADVTGHRPYIVTRYVPGRPLDEIVKDEGALDLPALIRIAHGVATALAAVHSVGVIHRDLKPGNVLILDGQPVLIDFGIAQAVDATRLTQTGMFIGTPGYLAPEIIEGQEAGPEVDVHAWAGTLLYAGTGQPPFGKGTLEMIFYNITAGKADVSAAPPELQPLLKAAFQRNPAKRPKAAELAEQTARLLPSAGAHQEISTVPRSDRSGELPTPPRPHQEAQPFVSLLPEPGHQAEPRPSQPPAGSGPQGGPGGYAQGQPPMNNPAAQGQIPTGPPPANPYPPRQFGGPEQTPTGGDPWPTRRVTPEELRQMQAEGGIASQPWPGNPGTGGQPAQQGWPSNQSAAPGQWQQTPPPYGQGNNHGFAPREGDVPTQRVRSEVPPYVPVQAPQQPQQPFGQDPATRREPYIPGARAGQVLQRSKAYGVAGAMLLILMIVLGAVAPLVVALVAIPFAILLRAADLAQPELIARRSSGTAAFDVVRVFAHPKALAKSLGITVALVPYALVLGLPVTLLLAIAAKMDPANALAWGAAVAVFTMCAGPGVEAPGRQMRRTLSSLVPSRTAAMVMAGVFAAGAALSLILAYGTIGATPRLDAVWSPVKVSPLTDILDGLKKSGG
ncbi:protein kinase [Nonomuraea sp. NBC_01738]|uniref:serine/threonine-protein kinase n=1 Tax=Nonomuraea sp. NBC_01738 TaxID=2976003 RepID=UPI002E11FE59|nr:protein kinase [Nonomuraea sp. NBC_01738]